MTPAERLIAAVAAAEPFKDQSHILEDFLTMGAEELKTSYLWTKKTCAEYRDHMLSERAEWRDAKSLLRKMLIACGRLPDPEKVSPT